MANGTKKDRQPAPVNPYMGKTREELTDILSRWGGKAPPEEIEPFKAAWQKAPGEKLQKPDIEVFQTFLNRAKDTGFPALPLIKILKGKKNPVIVPGEKLKLSNGSLNPAYAITPEDAIKWMSESGNVGVYGSPNALTIIDIDVKDGAPVIPKEKCEEIISSLDTLTIRTRSGGYHLYFTGCAETDNPHLYYDGKDTGECRRNWQYVVCPGSVMPVDTDPKTHTPDGNGRYEIILDRPIKRFDSELLPPWLNLGKPAASSHHTEGEKRTPRIQGGDFKNRDGYDLDDIRKRDKNGVLDQYLRGATEDDRSAGDYAVACKLIFFNFDDDTIARILQHYRPYEKTDRADYLAHTIEKARSETTERWKPSKAGRPRKDTPAPDQSEVSADIHNRAMEILKNGDPIGFLMEIFARDHVGDIILGKSYLACIGCTLCSNTAGIHPGTTGKSGSGKTHSMKAILHQMPKEYIVSGSFSGLAWMYDGMEPGTIIFIDEGANLKDIQQDIIKSHSSDYQHGLERHTVNSNTRKTETINVPPRCCWFINSVDGDFSAQFLNRQLSLTTSENQNDEIYNKQEEIGITGDDEFIEDNNWIVAQEIHRILKKLPLCRVRIPFLKAIAWNNKNNPRNYPMFLDIIRSFAAFRQFHRERADDTALIADKKDANDAMEIMEAISPEQQTHLSKNHLRVMQKIIELLRASKENELKRPDLEKALPDMKNADLSHILNGRKKPDGSYDGGLFSMVGGLHKGRMTIKQDGGEKSVWVDTITYVGALDLWKQFESIVTWKNT